MNRGLEFVIAVVLTAFLFLPMVFIAVIIKLTSTGPVLYWSKRIGRENTIFLMPKFRTMRTETPALATHLLQDPDKYLTRVGKRLRRMSLDELPQLYSVLKGDMRFVGPRPALYNQDDLIELRTVKGVHRLIPGITGWAQINGRDELPIDQKVRLDQYYALNRSFRLDLKIILQTAINVLKRKDVQH